MTVAYIAIGSNLASPLEQVNAALKALGDIPESHILAVSSFYRTPPLGPQDQPDYLNAAVALETSLAPEELLNHTQRIELQQGRVRKAERWGPRTLDLDIMLFGNEVINTERLTVPHYDMKNRGFMLWPLFEIAPELVFPDGEIRLLDADEYAMNKKRWHYSEEIDSILRSTSFELLDWIDQKKGPFAKKFAQIWYERYNQLRPDLDRSFFKGRENEERKILGT